MTDAMQNALTGVTSFVPRLIVKAISKLLEKVGFDKVVERAGKEKALDKSKFNASEIDGKLIFSTLMLFVLQLAFGVIAALNQIEVATSVTTPMLLTVLAIITGVVIVGAGGGLIKPIWSLSPLLFQQFTSGKEVP